MTTTRCIVALAGVTPNNYFRWVSHRGMHNRISHLSSEFIPSSRRKARVGIGMTQLGPALVFFTGTPTWSLEELEKPIAGCLFEQVRICPDALSLMTLRRLRKPTTDGQIQLSFGFPLVQLPALNDACTALDTWPDLPSLLQRPSVRVLWAPRGDALRVVMPLRQDDIARLPVGILGQERAVGVVY